MQHNLSHVPPSRKFFLRLPGLFQRIGRCDDRFNRGLTAHLHKLIEVPWRVHRGSDQLHVVEVQTTHVEAHFVSTQRASDDPSTSLAHQRQALVYELSGDHIQRDINPVRRGSANLISDFARTVDHNVGTSLPHSVNL